MCQHLEGMTKGNAVVLLDELNGVARLAAGHAMPQALVRRDDQVRFVAIVVERAAPDPVFAAVALQLDAPALDQRPQISAALHALDVLVGDSPGHDSVSSSGFRVSRSLRTATFMPRRRVVKRRENAAR